MIVAIRHLDPSVSISRILATQIPPSWFCFCFHVFQPRIDDKHSRWLHLRVRPSTFPFMDTAKHAAQGKVKTNSLVDGRWTLAFRDEDSCKSAMSMIVEKINLLCNEVERRLKPLLDLGMTVDLSNRNKTLQVSSSSTAPSTSL